MPAAERNPGPRPEPSPAWDPGQYLRHAGHRVRPFADLLARVTGLPGGRAPRIADLGCGPGNATTVLTGRWPGARVTGYDNSAPMLEAAAAHAGPTPGGGSLDFRPADLRTWTPDESYDLIVSNAALQWVPGHTDRFGDWLAGLNPGGTFAFQVPGNFGSPSHTLLAEVCARPRWRARLGPNPLRHDHVMEPAGYLDALVGLGCAAVDVWETTYTQLLQGPDPVLDWTKGTALRPVLSLLDGDPAARAEFTAEYRDLLRAAYPARPYGTVFPFRRIFAVAKAPERP
ncbi:trans-aconitate 2-methyltransferase [Actinacidiphila yeochonensis]|uniref:trans-aconitate 2-methyltransferase n=1 Tax=Actinacidiphila yeochonensis TaxID=89050 RepID=UPI00055A4BB6|nr:trans-aconitate 2-methyltransferase [Actinacidiphila yeochonensis]